MVNTVDLLTEDSLRKVSGGKRYIEERERALDKCAACGFKCSVGRLVRIGRDPYAIQIAIECEF